MFESSMRFIDALKIAGAFALVYGVFLLLSTLQGVLLIFFTSVIIAIAMDQLLDRFRIGVFSRTTSAALIYLAVVASVVAMLVLVTPPLVSELRNLLVDYPTYSEPFLTPDEVARFDIGPYLLSFSDSVTDSPAVVISTIFKTFSSLATFLAIFFVAFFLTIQAGGVRSFVMPLVPPQYQGRAAIFWDKLQDKVGSWLWGKTLSSLIVGFATFVGLYILGIPYALSLGILALFLNFIPFVGPIIASVPAIVLGFTISPIVGAVAALWYIIINSIIEPFVLTPLLMHKAIDINPAFLILSVISGAYIGGVLGIIIAIPVSAIAYLSVTEYWRQFHSAETTELHESV